MNLLHLKYAVEVAQASSISKAAEKLQMGQPNLSRAIRELEEALGIQIFMRNSKGIVLTPQGDEFLSYARKILAQVDAIEQMYNSERIRTQKFSITVPRACYISCAFTEFVSCLREEDKAEIFYMETNSMRSVSKVANDECKLGILRYPSEEDVRYRDMLREKGLRAELICEFRYGLLMSREHPLADREDISEDDLSSFVEILHADPTVSSLPTSDSKKSGSSVTAGKQVFLFERGSQMDILADVKNSFMWGSPVPKKILDRFELIQKPSSINQTIYRDMLICKDDYRFTTMDRMFIDELLKVKQQVCG